VKNNMDDIEQMKNKFSRLLLFTKKDGIDNLLNYLSNESDFFIAPASSNYHGNYQHGLLEHSLLVHKHFCILKNNYNINIDFESVCIITLLHDICKINFYEEYMKNVKTDGHWIQEKHYKINDKFPIGHGEKSVIILQKFIKLTDLEIYCIRWHMMSYDDVTKGFAGNLTLTNALNKEPCIALLHMADLASISLPL
jgi:hypothetical protein